MITAFTVAHSITLGLAALGAVSLPGRFVEPAIALSIAYVGIENLTARYLDNRWRVTFAFGLVHGFGFAGALAGVGLAPGEVPRALVMFNLGVELGQLALLALVLPIVLRSRRFGWFQGRAVPALSWCVVVAGIAWFAGRVGGGTG
jgi:hypothetical protein